MSIDSSLWLKTDIPSGVHSPDEEKRVKACLNLAALYSDPLVGFLQRKFSLDSEQAHDLVHEFIDRRIVEGRIVEGFDPVFEGKKRKFRHYLCRSLIWLYLDHKKQESKRREFQPELVYHEIESDQITDEVYEYVLAANLLIQSFMAVKADCDKKDQQSMWDVFAIRVIKQALTGKKEKHVDIAEQLGLESAKRSSHLLESARQKFRSFANRIIQESGCGFDNRTPEDLLKILGQPPLPDFDLCKHLKRLLELSIDENEIFLIETAEELKKAAEAWLNDREVDQLSGDELLWRQTVYQTVSEYQSGEKAAGDLQLSFSGLLSGSDEKLWDVFQSVDNEKSLTDIRRAAKKYLKQKMSQAETSMHRTIYSLVHASDIVNHMVCRSRIEPDDILSNIKSSLSKPWLDEQSRWQLKKAAELLRDCSVVFDARL